MIGRHRRRATANIKPAFIGLFMQLEIHILYCAHSNITIYFNQNEGYSPVFKQTC